MNKLVLELYKLSNNYKNYVDSQYWIYDIESIITREEGIAKRFLMVRFFNRFMNENSNLMRLCLKVNNEEVNIDNFSIVKKYKNKNVLGFVLERDLEDESTNVVISAYIVNGKKVIVDNSNLANQITIKENQQMMNLLKRKYTDKELIAIPVIEEDYWLCSCGCYNRKSDNLCKSCGTNKNIINQMVNIKGEDILDTVLEDIPINLDESVQDTVEKLVTKINSDYGIPQEIILSHINLDLLIDKQIEMKTKYIESFYENKKIKWNVLKSFEENIDTYCNLIKKKMITKDDVLSMIDTKKLEEEYERSIVKEKKDRKKVKRIIMLIFLTAITLIMLFIGKDIMDKKSLSKINDITLINTLEARKKIIKDDKCLQMALEESNNSEFDDIIDKYQACNNSLYSKEVNPIEIYEVDNKRVRSLGNGYFLVEETNKNGDEEILSYYLADKELNKISSSINSDNYIVTYDSKGRIEKITCNNTTVAKYTYNNNIIKIDYPVANVTKTIDEKNETITCVDNSSDSNGKQYVYNQKDETVHLSYAGPSNSERDYIINNGIVIEETYTGMKKTSNPYHYDANSLLTQFINTDDNVERTENYIYDFENDTVAKYESVLNEEDYEGLKSMFGPNITLYHLSKIQPYSNLEGCMLDDILKVTNLEQLSCLATYNYTNYRPSSFAEVTNNEGTVKRIGYGYETKNNITSVAISTWSDNSDTKFEYGELRVGTYQGKIEDSISSIENMILSLTISKISKEHIYYDLVLTDSNGNLIEQKKNNVIDIPSDAKFEFTWINEKNKEVKGTARLSLGDTIFLVGYFHDDGYVNLKKIDD